ncbi:MAG: PHP domain-containing protein [Longibaculum sp.]
MMKHEKANELIYLYFQQSAYSFRKNGRYIRMFYDLHIHSALSPCSDDDMTLNNIVNMACLKELDLIAITDHNSVKQLYHLADVAQDKIRFIYGVEIQSREEIHVLAYFLDKQLLDTFQAFLDCYLIEEPNDEYYFGHQYIFNEVMKS